MLRRQRRTPVASRTQRRADQGRALLWELHGEVARLRLLGAEAAGAAAAAEVRSRRSGADLLDLAAEVARLREEVARLREELLWAWAEGRLPTDGETRSETGWPAASPAGRPRVIDLRTPPRAARPA